MILRILKRVAPSNKLARSFRERTGQLKKKFKEKVKARAAVDDKMIKLTVKEDVEARQEREAKFLARRGDRISNVQNLDPSLEFGLIAPLVTELDELKRKADFDLNTNPHQVYEMYDGLLDKYLEDDTNNAQKPIEYIDESTEQKMFSPLNRYSLDELKEGRFKMMREHYVTDDLVNSKFYKKGLSYSPVKTGKRCGVLAKKIGMMSLYDRWGVYNPVTVLHIDRCQVTQHFTEEINGFDAIQVGMGEKSMKRIKKSQIGHFLKAGVSPKVHLKQFRVEPTNFLPIGFQIGARHFTPGQYIDCSAIAKHKGFSGVMKRWGFGGQSASHGTTKTHRQLGSTGQCQDAGRVFKGKKMYGHMGGRPAAMRNLKVFRIDHERSLVYVKGSVPGKRGEVVEITDSFLKFEENERRMNYPTFIPQEGEKYANIVQMEEQEQDPNEIYLHDEALPKERDDENSE